MWYQQIPKTFLSSILLVDFNSERLNCASQVFLSSFSIGKFNGNFSIGVCEALKSNPMFFTRFTCGVIVIFLLDIISKAIGMSQVSTDPSQTRFAPDHQKASTGENNIFRVNGFGETIECLISCHLVEEVAQPQISG